MHLRYLKKNVETVTPADGKAEDEVLAEDIESLSTEVPQNTKVVFAEEQDSTENTSKYRILLPAHADEK